MKFFGQRTDMYKQFWNLRYQVQKFHQPSHDQAEKDISFRLTALNQVARFDTKAIHEIRVRRAVKELTIGAELYAATRSMPASKAIPAFAQEAEWDHLRIPEVARPSYRRVIVIWGQWTILLEDRT